MGLFWVIFSLVITILLILLVFFWVLHRWIFGLIVRELGEPDSFHITPSPVERPSLGPDLGLSYWMNEFLLRFARLRDLEEDREEGDPE